MAHKKHSHEKTVSSLGTEELEARAHHALSQAKWRQARDVFKVLRTREPEKYLPGLVAANRGLAEELLEKGLISEAEQILVYLRTLAPAGTFAGVELAAKLREQQWSEALKLALDTWQAHGQNLDETDRCRVADALVLGFPDTAQSADWPKPLNTELPALLEALHALSQERFQDAQDLLRPLPRSSIFAAWKTFIKAWVTLHAGDPKKALALCDSLPAQSVPGRAALGLRALADPALLGDSSGAQTSQAATAVGYLLGAPQIGARLPQADALWKAGQHVKSLDLLRQAPEFPSRESNLAGALSDFYFRVGQEMPWGVAQKYQAGLERRGGSGTWKNAAEKFYYDRLQTTKEDATEAAWRTYLGHFQTHPSYHKLLSLGLLKLAQLQIEAKEESWGVEAGAREAVAARLLEEGVREDPQNRAAYLELLRIYRDQNAEAKSDELLDAYTRSFPGNKAVWTEAGLFCADRQLFARALGYFEAARALDPLDPQTLQFILAARTKHAARLYRNKELTEARALFNSIHKDFAIDGPVDLNQGRDFLLARQGVLELVYASKAKGEKLIDSARAFATSPPALELMLHGWFRVYSAMHGRAGKGSPFFETIEAPENHQERRDWLAALDRIYHLDEDLDWAPEMALIQRHLMALPPRTLDPEEVNELLDFLMPHEALRKAGRRLVKGALRKDPKHLHLRLAHIALEEKPPVHRIAELEEIHREAALSGDTDLVKACSTMIEKLRAMDTSFGPSFEEEEEPDFLPFIPGSLSKEDIMKLRRDVETMNEADYRELREWASGLIPPEIFDEMMGRKLKKP